MTNNPDRPDPEWRMFRAVQLVDERLQRAMEALSLSSIHAAVIGAKAVEAWVFLRDPEAVRNTPNVDLLIYRSSLATAQQALQTAGFVRFGDATQPAEFLDGPTGTRRSALRLWFADEPVSPGTEPLPSMLFTLPTLPYRRVSLPMLVQMKLSSFRRIDRVHLQDMVRVGLIDATWPDRFIPILADRLREILADPEG